MIVVFALCMCISVDSTPEKRNPSSIVGEVISTSHGTSFYIHTSSSNDGHQGPGTFLTQDEGVCVCVCVWSSPSQ